ncbi:MAG: PaaI family thioesterase [Archangiaceae bacterium]|nr:PaaI family thioesterase [Archangiaceae bacterium]
MNESDPAPGLELLNAAFRDFIPHNKVLGFEIIEASFDPPYVIARLPYDERLVGHPDSGLLHGGVVTTLLDAAGGAAVYTRLNSPQSIATLDLRIDYLKPAAGRLAVSSRAECIKCTRNVAFVRMTAYQEDLTDPIAMGAATYMIGTPGQAVTQGFLL